MKIPAILAGRRRRLVLRLFANGVAQAVGTVAAALLVRNAFERISEGLSPSGERSFLIVIGVFSAIVLATFALRFVERQDAVSLGEDYVGRIRIRLFDALTSTSLVAGRHRNLGPAMLPFVTDLTAVRQWVSNGFARLIVSLLASIGGLAALLVVDPVFGALVTGIAILCALAGVALARPLSQRVRDLRRRRGQMAAHIGDRLRALTVVRLSGQIGRERRILSKRSLRLGRAAMARARLSNLVRILPDIALGISTTAILVVGGHRLVAGETAQGAIVAALLVLGAIAPHARAFGRVFEYWTNYRIAVGKLNDIIGTAKRRRRGGRRLTDDSARGRLEFRDATLNTALNGVSLACTPGTRVAVIGPSGCGKSSLLMAAAGRRRLSQGKVWLDGVDISRLDLTDLARTIGIVSPEFPLVKGTVRENLTYRFPEATEQDVAEACALSGFETVSQHLPDGLGTRINEQGNGLPAGLRQRLCLARALMGRPALLILDDPDAGLDPAGRKALDRVLESSGSTVLLTTHDLRRAAGADIICYMESGKIVETGTPQALMTANGPVDRFFAAQEVTSADAPRSNITRFSSSRAI